MDRQTTRKYGAWVPGHISYEEVMEKLKSTPEGFLGEDNNKQVELSIWRAETRNGRLFTTWKVTLYD